MRYFVIRTENLTKWYGRRIGIDNLTMEVEPGEVYGFLGPDSSGKTTTIRLLLDGLRPTRGNALVLGLDAQRQGKEIRRRVGFLPGEFSLYNHMSVNDYLVNQERQRGQSVAAYGQELARRLQLSTSQRIASLPEGEKRKLGLVQAFMFKPELYIFDEPTKDLDREAQSTFYQLVSEARAEGRSVFFSSTSLSEVERVCDRVGVLHHGSLLAVERGVQLRSRAVRRVEMRFADPVCMEDFTTVPNIDDVRLVDNKLFCTVHGEPDSLIKAASQHRVTDVISQQISLEEAFSAYYGLRSYAS